ncbi:MAG: cell division protein FtsL [Pseudomonadales bacterium]|nr:cell division protein FtsL [Gammaproteobacteria bacterium]NNL57058.1 cell division protein FtsL [Pseudomonadales bacterium]
MFIVLALMLLVSALAVAYSGHLNRQSFIALKKAIAMQTELQVTHGKLLLEKSAWTSPAVIQARAEQDLAMRAPAVAEVIFVATAPLSDYQQLQLAESRSGQLPGEGVEP